MPDDFDDEQGSNMELHPPAEELVRRMPSTRGDDGSHPTYEGGEGRNMELHPSQTYDFEGYQIRLGTLPSGDQGWVVRDVAAALEMNRRSFHERVRKYPENEHGVVTILTPGGRQQCKAVNAVGLTRLLMRTSSPRAERFRLMLAGAGGNIVQTGEYRAPELPQPNPSTAIAPAAQPSSNNIDSMITLAQQQVQSLQIAREQQQAINLHGEQIRILNENSETLAGAIREVESRAQQIVETATEEADRLRADFTEWADRDENIPYPECITRINALVRKFVTMFGETDFRTAFLDVYTTFKSETGYDLQATRTRYNAKYHTKYTILQIADIKGYARELLRSVRYSLGSRIEEHEAAMAEYSMESSDELLDLIAEGGTWH